MVTVEKSEKFLKADDIKGKASIIAKIISEAKPVEGQYGTKLEARVRITADGDTFNAKWSLNNKTQDTLIDKFGKDTSDWIGKEIPLEVQTINNKPSIVPKA